MHLSPLRAAVGAPVPNVKADWKIVGASGISSVETGLARQQRLADEIDETARPVLVVWRCHQALLVSRTETRLHRFQQACIELESAGWPVIPRKSGGGACPVGPGTLQVATIEAAAPDATMHSKYVFLAGLIQATLRSFQIISETCLVPKAYCSGRFDVAVKGKKIAGISQHWFRNARDIRCVSTTASINVEEAPETLAHVVNRFYRCAGNLLHCEANAITSVRLYSSSSTCADQNLVAAVSDSLARMARTSLDSRAEVALG
jgi:octanoyl-[GcvH]:protein N-octanoyltransferase